MSKSRKALIGICSFLPAILMAVYIVTFLSIMLPFFRHIPAEGEFPEHFFRHMGLIIATALLMGAASLAMKIYFIIHAINNPAAEGTERVAWILIFIFAGLIGYPIYWYMRIWTVQEADNPVPIRYK